MSDDEREEGVVQGTEEGDDSWTYIPPPQSQSSHYFKVDGLLFDSKFDSGNLMDVERLGPYNYNLNMSRDCEGAPKQTSNKQWFHFSISGGLKGHTIQITMTNIPCCKMYSFPGYAPAVAIAPIRPAYSRLNTRVQIKKLDPVPILVPTTPIGSDSGSLVLPPVPTSGGGKVTPPSELGSGIFTFENITTAPSSTPTTSTAPTTPAAAVLPPKKPTTMCNLTFEYTFEVDSLLKLDVDQSGAQDPELLPSNYTTTTYLANAHPYPYAKLQKHLAAWDTSINGPTPCTSTTSTTSAASTGGGSGARTAALPNKGEIYYHRELLTWSLDGNRCDLLTITGMNGMAPTTSTSSSSSSSSSRPAPRSSMATTSSAAPSVATALGSASKSGKVTPSPPPPPSSSSDCYEAMLDTDLPVPPSLCRNSSTGRGGSITDTLPPELLADRCCPKTGRAKRFPNKKYVILSARVHPGEIPASHILHGALEFLLHKTDPRAEQLRQHFVFVIVPMINPDGVVRGHSRADTTGQNLNRTYANPSPKRHPTVYALKKLMFALEATKRLALYVDLHAHANKRGMFFYGNAMKAQEQIQNLLYAKLLSMNTPYFEFQSCNFSESNMSAMGKNGESKDSSSRVVLFKETGFIHSYTLEGNYVVGTTLNEVKGLGPNFPGEENGSSDGQPSPKYSYPIFHDVGRAICTSLLDLHSLNVASRIPLSGYHSVKNVAAWIQKTLVTDAWEQQRRQSVLQSGQSLTKEREKGLPTFSTMASTSFPEWITTKATKVFPPTTVQELSSGAKGPPKEPEALGKGNVAPTGVVSRKPFENAAAAAAAASTNISVGALGAKKTSLSGMGRASSGPLQKKAVASRVIPPPSVNNNPGGSSSVGSDTKKTTTTSTTTTTRRSTVGVVRRNSSLAAKFRAISE